DPSAGASPEGGIEAWLVALGGACIFFCGLGFSAYVNFREYYVTHQIREDSTDKITWLRSLGWFMRFTMGMIGAPLFDRYSA
ncbi:hypothetical protein CC80DRAFT_431774, partial [Byssothecium circinans]